MQKDGEFVEDIELIINVISDVEKSRYQNSHRFKDLWNGLGSFSEREIEFEDKLDMYKIFRSTKYKYSKNTWDLLKIKPGSTPLPKDVFEFWVGQCLLGKSPITRSGEHVRCNSYILYGNILIEFSLSEINIKKVEEVRYYLTNLIKSWQVK